MKKSVLIISSILIIFLGCYTSKKVPFSKKNKLNSSCAKELNQYQNYSIYLENDTINYHIYPKINIDSINNLIIYVQGSGPSPLFKVKKEGNSTWIYGSMPFDLDEIPEDYLFVLISKKGIPFCIDYDENYIAPPKYYENETLDYRANQVDIVIKDLLTLKKNSEFSKVVVLGHSEGSDVIAKVGTINEDITHFGYWSGSGNSQWYDFPLFVRQQVNKGEISEEESIIQMDSLLSQYRDIMANKDNIEKSWLGNSYKRWYYFSEPPIKNLLQINKPIFVAMGTADKSVPIESIYLVPIEFIRHGKTNLSFNIYPHLDHSLNKIEENGEIERYWNKIFLEFLNWVKKN